MLLTKFKKTRKELLEPLDYDWFQRQLAPQGTLFGDGIRIVHDPWYKLCRKAEEDPRFRDVIESFRLGEMSRKAGMEFLNADGNLLHDTRQQSIIAAAQTAVVGTTTAKMLHPAGHTNLPPGYFCIVKKVRQTIAASVTHGAAVGNVTPVVYYGSADAATTLLCTGVAQAGVNAGVGPYIITAFGESRGGALANAVPMIAYGIFQAPIALILAANLCPAMPAGAIAPQPIDSMAGLGFMIQCLNSGANGSSYVTHDITFEALM